MVQKHVEKKAFDPVLKRILIITTLFGLVISYWISEYGTSGDSSIGFVFLFFLYVVFMVSSLIGSLIQGLLSWKKTLAYTVLIFSITWIVFIGLVYFPISVHKP
jgi:hypothetical protein